MKQALPGCEVTWTYTLYGKEHSSAETELDFRGTGITDLSELGAMLPYLDHVERVYLTDLDIPSKKIEAMADAFPEVKFVWRLRVVFWSVMTDAKSFSTRNYDPPSYRLSSREAEKLRYCDELEALDLGHNGITDLSFVKHMPGLKILILADNEVRDISALSELKELEYIELFKNHITDLTPLTKLPKLQDLNLCYNRIQDFSPLCEMSGLKRLWLNGTKVDKATAAELTESLPDCRIVTDGDHSTSSGWREHERYDWMIACFN